MDLPSPDNNASDVEAEVEFDENDRKIIQLYEVINELIDEQKARSQDLELLYAENDNLEILSFVESRNETVLKQMFDELELTEKNNSDDENSDDEDEDSEDEQDEGWEIYNSVVNNLNDYMQKVADFSAKLKAQQEIIAHYEGPQEEEIKELENVVGAQTAALEQQMKRCLELESALGNVLKEYSDRINVSNTEISSLHIQLSQQNELHGQQLQVLREMYEKKIEQLSTTQSVQYREELHEVLQTLSQSRDHFHKATNEMAQDMRESQERHHKEIITLRKDVTSVTAQLADKQIRIKELEHDLYNMKQPALRVVRCELDIDDDDESFGKPSFSILRPIVRVNKSRSGSNASVRSNSSARNYVSVGGLQTIASEESSDNNPGGNRLAQGRNKAYVSSSGSGSRRGEYITRKFTPNTSYQSNKGSAAYENSSSVSKSGRNQKFARNNNFGKNSRGTSGFKSGSQKAHLMQKYSSSKYVKNRSTKRTMR